MESGSYFPTPVKAVPIPKKSGGTRILGVPTVADRVAQTLVKMILEPMLEPVFDRDSMETLGFTAYAWHIDSDPKRNSPQKKFTWPEMRKGFLF